MTKAKELRRERGSGAPTSRGGSGAATEGPERAGAERSSEERPQLVSRISKDVRSRACMCACGTRTKGGRFAPGHDVRMVSYAKEYLRGERELTDEQMAYVRDSGKLERARARLAEEERRRREQAARKAERQAKAQTKDEK
jgi:hypothetical protein